PGNELSSHFGELLQAEPLENFLKRKVLTKGDEMHLVIETQHRPVMIDYIDRSARVGACRRRGRTAGAIGPRDQHCLLRQQGSDLGERVRLGVEIKGKRRLRPDQMRHIVKAM